MRRSILVSLLLTGILPSPVLAGSRGTAQILNVFICEENCADNGYDPLTCRRACEPNEEPRAPDWRFRQHCVVHHLGNGLFDTIDCY